MNILLFKLLIVGVFDVSDFLFELVDVGDKGELYLQLFIMVFLGVMYVFIWFGEIGGVGGDIYMVGMVNCE